ncbi:MAG: hypothetical protein OXH53_11035 [bacterium]|nr:hypothetical protein [bacterium]
MTATTAQQVADLAEREAYETVVAAREELAAARAAGQPPGVCAYLQRRYLETLEAVYGSAS